MRNKIIGLCMIVVGSGVFVYFIRFGLCHWPFGLNHALVVFAACLGVAAVITGAYLIASRIPALREHALAIRRCFLALFFIASVGSAYYYWYWNDIRFLRARLEADAIHLTLAVEQYFMSTTNETCNLSDIWATWVSVSTKERGATYTPDVFTRGQESYSMTIYHPRLKKPVRFDR